MDPNCKPPCPKAACHHIPSLCSSSSPTRSQLQVQLQLTHLPHNTHIHTLWMLGLGEQVSDGPLGLWVSVGSDAHKDARQALVVVVVVVVVAPVWRLLLRLGLGQGTWRAWKSCTIMGWLGPIRATSSNP